MVQEIRLIRSGQRNPCTIRCYITIARIARRSGNWRQGRNFRFSQEFRISLTANELRCRDATCRVRLTTMKRSVRLQRSDRLGNNGRCIVMQRTADSSVTERWVARTDATRSVPTGSWNKFMVCFTRYFALFFCLEKRKNGTFTYLFLLSAFGPAISSKTSHYSLIPRNTPKRFRAS